MVQKAVKTNRKVDNKSVKKWNSDLTYLLLYVIIVHQFIIQFTYQLIELRGLVSQSRYQYDCTYSHGNSFQL